MKRLIRKAFGTTLYHGTSLEALEQITSMGMIMPQESGGAGIGEDNETELRDIAYEKAKEDGADTSDEEILEEYYELEEDKFKEKFEGYTFFAGTLNAASSYANDNDPRVVIEVSVPEESLFPDDNDCWSCKTWQESLQRTNQVKVIGPITEDYIVGVHIGNIYGLDFYPKLTWKDNYKKDSN